MCMFLFITDKIAELDEEEWDPMADDYYNSMNTATLNTENYDSVTTGYIPQDEGRVCRFFRASGTCYKGDINVGYIYINYSV